MHNRRRWDPFFYAEVAVKIHSTLSFKQIRAISIRPPKKTLNGKGTYNNSANRAKTFSKEIAQAWAFKWLMILLEDRPRQIYKTQMVAESLKVYIYT